MNELFSTSDAFETLSGNLIDLKINYNQVIRKIKFCLDYLGDSYVDESLDNIDLHELNEITSNVLSIQQEIVNNNEKVIATLQKLQKVLDKAYYK